MVWVPKEGECIICGEKIMLNSSRTKYCPECRRIMFSHAQDEYKDIRIAHRLAQKRGMDLAKYKGEENECKVKRQCIYGSEKYCEYMTVTGRSRLFAGYPIEKGRCKLFKRGKRKLPAKSVLPAAPVLSPGKLGEV